MEKLKGYSQALKELLEHLEERENQTVMNIDLIRKSPYAFTFIVSFEDATDEKIQIGRDK